MSDDELLEAVERAVAGRVQSGQAAALVSQPAWVDTSHDPGPANFMRNLNTDEQAPEPLPRAIATARAFVFWQRPLAAVHPRVVGIFWGPDDLPRRFFAVVLPN